jgi:hypothetical protein
MGEKLKWEDRNTLRITKGQMDHHKKMASARYDLYNAIVEVEQKYELSIMEMLSLLHNMDESFLNAGLEYEEKERWEEEANGIQEKS